VWRCTSGCEIGQVVPLDDALELEANQRTGIQVKRLACILAVFVPYEVAAILLGSLTGVNVSSSSIWNWVQWTGELAQTRLQAAIEAAAADETSVEATLPVLWPKLVLALGADGVMAPFRPHGGVKLDAADGFSDPGFGDGKGRYE